MATFVILRTFEQLKKLTEQIKRIKKFNLLCQDLNQGPPALRVLVENQSDV